MMGALGTATSNIDEKAASYFHPFLPIFSIMHAASGVSTYRLRYIPNTAIQDESPRGESIPNRMIGRKAAEFDAEESERRRSHDTEENACRLPR